ncbi:hypothetical protein [Gemmata sp.]|uniref:hypothetical protein n=1 Tax=Gemmata sp. TaxID=1914242 RepID=UPI003F6ED7C9
MSPLAPRELSAEEVAAVQWLARPLACDGAVVLPGLDLARLRSSDLRTICLRMSVILGTIEDQIGGGRFMPLDLSYPIDDLSSLVFHGHREPDGRVRPPRLGEWVDLIRRFGEHYRRRLGESGPIAVDPDVYRFEASIFQARAERSP